MKEEALKLADDLEELHEQDLIDGVAHLSMPQASAMIRRLVEELDRLVGAEPITHGKLTFCKNCGQQDPYTQTKPLSDDEIDKVASIKMNQILMDLIGSEDWNKGCTKQHLVNFARVIEERHGIK